MTLASFIWRRLDGTALEYFRLLQMDGGFRGSGTVVGTFGGIALRLVYSVDVDTVWRFQRASLQRETGEGVRCCEIQHEPDGWVVDGVGRADLKQCIDIDLAASPFTNTLPINRLKPGEGETAMTAAYVAMPDLEVKPVAQSYAKLSDAPDHYVYNGIFRGFSGVLRVDELGLVERYADTFDRLAGGQHS